MIKTVCNDCGSDELYWEAHRSVCKKCGAKSMYPKRIEVLELHAKEEKK
jgi:predicted nucleic-acid-binding Zn-ribbon protein